MLNGSMLNYVLKADHMALYDDYQSFEGRIERFPEGGNDGGPRWVLFLDEFPGFCESFVSLEAAKFRALSEYLEFREAEALA